MQTQRHAPTLSSDEPVAVYEIQRDKFIVLEHVTDIGVDKVTDRPAVYMDNGHFYTITEYQRSELLRMLRAWYAGGSGVYVDQE